MILSFHPRLRTTLACGLAFGAGFFGCHLYWIAIFGKLPWLGLTLFQSLYIVAWVLAVRYAGIRQGPWGRLLLLPSAWVCMEWLRSIGMLGFTWGDIGYSQHQLLPLIQIASLTGVWGVSFLIAAWNAMLANIATYWNTGRRSISYQVCAVLLLLSAVLVYGVAAMRSPMPTDRQVEAAAIQGNINTDTEHDLAYFERCHGTYWSLTRKAALAGATLIVWPETAEPGYPARDQFLEYSLSQLALETRSYILLGAHDEDQQGRYFNSGFLIAPGQGIVGRYSKVRLVPFGEYVPARRYLPFLSYYRVTPVDLTAGTDFNLLKAGRTKIGLAICFESIFPYICRTLTHSGAEILCIITNDAWFERTAAAEQHASKSVLRAIENGRYVVRAATTGVSCIIDPHGRILARKGIFEQGIVKAKIVPLRRKTLYTRMGDWFVFLCFGVTGGLTIWSLCKRMTN